MTTPVHGKAVGLMEFGDHLCLSYDNADERQAILLAYIRDGLAADHKIIYLSDEDPPEAVVGWLEAVPEAAGLDLAGALADGRLVVRTAEEAYMATGRFDPDEIIALFGTEIELALTQGFKGVRVTGEETFSLRGWPGTERFAEFERKIDEVFRTSRVNAMAICQYDRRWFDRERLAELESHHVDRVRADDLHDDGTLRIAPVFGPPGVALSGAVHAAARPALTAALAALPARAGLVCLDLSGVEGCDADGLRALIDAARDGGGRDGGGRDGGGRERHVLLRGLPEKAAVLLRDTGLLAMPGVSVEGAPG
ncbi:MEDS domain-containing protein [Spirillospora sp. NPDC029432]|uniref:MEDS domain-containing protein n=1 Tax=Spirillospora sp. NPDC029432 TaxID=3154599 RepID=UPI00345301A6